MNRYKKCSMIRIIRGIIEKRREKKQYYAELYRKKGPIMDQERSTYGY